MTDQGHRPDLGYLDFYRQDYGPGVKIDTYGEFMIGDYGDDSGGVDKGGEFKLLVHRFEASPGAPLALQVCVFHDGIGSFRAAQALGLLDAIEQTTVTSLADVSDLLDRLGIRDLSRIPRRYARPR